MSQTVYQSGQTVKVIVDSEGAEDAVQQALDAAAAANASAAMADEYRLATEAAASIQIVTITGTTYTIQASDKGKFVYFTAATAVSVTVPSGLGADFFCSVIQGGLGKVSLSAGSGAIVVNADSSFGTQTRYVRLTLFAVGADALLLEGRTA